MFSFGVQYVCVAICSILPTRHTMEIRFDLDVVCMDGGGVLERYFTYLVGIAFTYNYVCVDVRVRR